MKWEVEYTDEFGEWFKSLSENVQEAVAQSIAVLEAHGPALGRPLADTINQSRHANMKELRPPRSGIRILFAFDPRRYAILLLGGDKTGNWRGWYDTMIPIADRLYDEHLEILKAEGLL